MVRKRIPVGVRGLLIAPVLLLASCATNVAVYSADVSVDDMRLRLTLQTCNPSSVSIYVTDVGHRVELAVAAYPSRLLGGPECQHPAIVALPEPLGDRDVFDRSARNVVPVSLSSRDWPYDRDRFTMADYETALAAMVACLESRDPANTGRASSTISTGLPTSGTRKRDERGNTSAPARRRVLVATTSTPCVARRLRERRSRRYAMRDCLSGSG